MKGQAQFKKFHDLIVKKGVAISLWTTSKKILCPFKEGVDGQSSPKAKRIELIHTTRNPSMETATAVMAHEYGHIIAREKYGRPRINLIDQTIMMSQPNPYSKVSKQAKKVLYKDEVIAWDEAEKFLRRYGYKSWNIFEEVKRISLATYRDGFWNLK